jgi:antitoxin ParD1/3/4
MNVTLTGELAEFVNQKVASGRYPTASEVVQDALRLLRESDEKQARLEDLRREIDIGIQQADAGDLAPFDPMETLAKVRASRAAGERKGA